MALLALARMTISDGIRQPLTWLAVGVSIGLIALSFLFGMFNFETQDRLRMLCTAGVAVAVLNGLFLGVVLASTAIHDELASRTALTLFAKPLSRGSYLAGKALGVWTVVACASLVIALAHGASLFLALWTQFESFDDGHGHGLGGDLWVPWGRMLGAHLLALAHAGVTTALAAVLALRLPLVANILACFAIFVLGHLLPGLGWHGLLFIPDLAAFNVDDSLQLVSQPLTVGYCLLTFLYALLCCTGCGLLGLAVFARQDIP